MGRNESGVTGEPHPPTTSATARGMQSAIKYDRCHVKIESDSTALRREENFRIQDPKSVSEFASSTRLIS